ncbi:hypothetical protein COLO4_26639 [Corchorus olitorius]|uniref:Uncharacterized protein n=1 Tax=Corchorus olitorius TaxID=93759 RepID=A0A1R3HV82_9ROSI|nr:hypothetical protein COLO4_26639 [Corchorus olitorius]
MGGGRSLGNEQKKGKNDEIVGEEEKLEIWFGEAWSS